MKQDLNNNETKIKKSFSGDDLPLKRTAINFLLRGFKMQGK